MPGVLFDFCFATAGGIWACMKILEDVAWIVTILQFIIVCPMVFLAGFVDAIAGEAD